MFLGFDLSIEGLRACLVDENLELVGVECVDFDTDCAEYGTQGGIFTSPGEAYTTPVEMWIKGLGEFCCGSKIKIQTHVLPKTFSSRRCIANTT